MGVQPTASSVVPASVSAFDTRYGGDAEAGLGYGFLLGRLHDNAKKRGYRQSALHFLGPHSEMISHGLYVRTQRPR